MLAHIDTVCEQDEKRLSHLTIVASFRYLLLRVSDISTFTGSNLQATFSYVGIGFALNLLRD